MTRENTKQGGPEAGIIYCRVSSKKQVSEGNGLQSQEITCREYMDRAGIKVLGVFRDDLTGKTQHRNGFRNALGFLRSCRLGTKVVIDDGDRLARGLRTHLAIRDAIVAAGGKLVSPKREYTDDPEDDILEIVEAAFAGEHRRKNAAQTSSRMRGRCLAGHWCLQLPRGYKYRKDKSKGQGAIIDRDEPIATIVQQALEGYACGHLETQADVARYLASQPDFPRQKNGRVPDEVARIMLRNPLFAGYVHVPHWDVSLRPGHHPALISFETFQKIQRRLTGASKGIVRKDNAADFALRGYVVCSCCGTRLTSYWAKGSHGRYAYYHCRERSCEAYARAIPRAKIEGEFGDLVRAMQPSPAMFGIVDQGLRQLWREQEERAGERKRSLTVQLRTVQSEIRKLVDRTLATENPTLIGAYEGRLNEAEAEKIELSEKIAGCGRPLASFDDAFRTSMGFLASPWKFWESGRIEQRQLLLKLAFVEPLGYARESGFRTPSTSSPFTLFRQLTGEREGMARPTGFEPVA